MKRLIALIPVVMLFSCKKENTGSSIQGKWQLIEVYSGYVMGGCLCWQSVPSVNAHILEFKVTGSYAIILSPLSSASACSGRYRVLNDSTLAMTYDCQSDPNQEFTRSYSKSLNQLILDYQTIEGTIRYKYVKL